MNALIDLGAWTLEQVRHVGRMAIFALQLFKELPASLARFWLVVQQIHFIGNYSLLIIAVSGLFVGFVLALQGYYILVSYGSEQALGVMVALSLARELGPVVAGTGGRHGNDGGGSRSSCVGASFLGGTDFIAAIGSYFYRCRYFRRLDRRCCNDRC